MGGRLSPLFHGGARALLSATWAHRLQPNWPLCPFEGAPHGACHNDGCPFQMARDYALPPQAALQDVYDLAARSAPACCSYSGSHALNPLDVPHVHRCASLDS